MSNKQQKTELKVTAVPESLEEAKKTLNPYVPLYISKAPWYGEKAPLPKNDSDPISKWYQKGKRGNVNTKYKPGNCENCGASTHKRKDCVERPRKVGAKWSGVDLQPDEVVQKVDLGFAAKRDRWNGYDPQEQLKQVEEFRLVEEKRAEKRQQKAKEKLSKPGLEGLDSSDEDDDVRYGDQVEVVAQKVDTNERVTVRNLRIREDVAKYLLNLDENSAEYNPKSRGMKQNPFGSDISKPFRGDDFEKYSGQVKQAKQIQDFAWDVEQKGIKLTLEANPTQGELLYRKFYEDEKTTSLKKIPESILEKYGGQEHLNSMPKEMLMAQTEQYLEYTANGELVTPNVKTTIKRSKYVEDEFNGNHSSVWGSWWHNFQWGYKCCHSTLKKSYCAGEAGKTALRTVNALKSDRKMLVGNSKGTVKPTGNEKVELDKEKLAQALKAEDERKDSKWADTGRKRRYGGIPEDQLTPEQLEAYRLKKIRAEDPMANYKDEFDLK
jgi:pre-mRNA-processing factor SLU7